MAQTDIQPNGKATEIEGKGGKGKRRPPSKGLRTISVALKPVTFSGKVDPTPLEWKQLPTFAWFSTAEDGSFLCCKDSSSSYIEQTGQHHTGIAYGQVYRVYL